MIFIPAKDLVPHYQHGDINENILLLEDTGILQYESCEHEVEAKVFLELKNKSGFFANIQFSSQADFQSNWSVLKLMNKERPLSLLLKKINLNVAGFFTRFGGFTLPGNELQPFVWCFASSGGHIPIGNESTEIHEVDFHLYNFPNYFGPNASWKRQDDMTRKINHLNLISNEWQVEVKSLFSIDDVIKKLKENGGYGLTHVGRFQKKDGSSFSGKDALMFSEYLGLFLSFACGFNCIPTMLIGFDSARKKVWEHWVAPQSPCRKVSNWFDIHHGEQLENLFQNFIQKIEDEQWKNIIYTPIRWLSICDNSSSREAAIICAQAALEGLADNYLNLNNIRQKKDGVTDKITRFLETLQIPLEINENLRDFANNTKKTFKNVVELLVKIRNDLVHTKKAFSNVDGLVLFHCYNHFAWLIELSLLKICDYHGTYSNRLILNGWVGNVENVPWIRNEGTKIIEGE